VNPIPDPEFPLGLEAQQPEKLQQQRSRAALRNAGEILGRLVVPGDPPMELGVVTKPKLTVPDILRAAAKTFEERNGVYGSNYRMVGPMVKILFPDEVPSHLVESDRWHLFELILVKLSRFAISGLDHEDSIHDLVVYAAMVEMLVKEGK
jgi:hypothetical protein